MLLFRIPYPRDNDSSLRKVPVEARIFQEFRDIVGPRGLITSLEDLRTYECDGLTNFRVLPRAVLLPSTTEQVQSVVRVCHRERIPFVARGSGTGLSGGALPVENGIVISLAKMNRILEVDLPNARVVVEPGVINLDVTCRVLPQEYFYAPDPSSQSVCSIGGNVAENSGGAHCLKYGFTTNHVVAVRLVLEDGSIVDVGAEHGDPLGYDLTKAVVGSEGMLGIVTEVVVRILRKPQSTRTLFATFPTTDEAGEAVSRIIAAGIVPAAIEMCDTLAIEAIVASTGVDWPRDVGAVLLMDVDGVEAEAAHTAAEAERIARGAGALEIRTPR